MATTTATATRVYYGKRLDMVEEVGAYDTGDKYLVLGDSDVGVFDTIGCATIGEAKAVALEWARADGCKAIRIS